MASAPSTTTASSSGSNSSSSSDAQVAALQDMLSKHGDGFKIYWEKTQQDSRVQILKTARDLLVGRVFQDGSIDQPMPTMLLPELVDARIDKLAGPLLLPLMDIRAFDAPACAIHDKQYISVAIASMSPDDTTIARLAASRSDMVTTFLHDVLVIYAHSLTGAAAKAPAETATASGAGGGAGAGFGAGAAEAVDGTKGVTPPPAPPVAAAAAVDGQRARLTKSDLAPSPIVQFVTWLQAAAAAGLVPRYGQPMTLATASPSGVPSARIVLLKRLDERGFVFHSNYSSRKGMELAVNPVAALVFHWPQQNRQVRVEGTVERLPSHESDVYWATRPRKSKIGGWASNQSTVISGVDALQAQYDRAAALFAGGADKAEVEVPRPPGWGGYLVRPVCVEFWVGDPARLHDRLRYRAVAQTASSTETPAAAAATTTTTTTTASAATAAALGASPKVVEGTGGVEVPQSALEVQPGSKVAWEVERLSP